MPQAIKPIRPELEDYQYNYLSAFYDLSTCRPLGMESVGPIPYTAIILWLQFWQIEIDEAEIYIDVISRLDQVYMEHVYKKRDEVSSGLDGRVAGHQQRVKKV